MRESVGLSHQGVVDFRGVMEWGRGENSSKNFTCEGGERRSGWQRGRVRIAFTTRLRDVSTFVG